MRTELIPLNELSAALHRSLYDQLDQHFQGVTPETFAADLAEKTHALILFDQDAPVGFSTFAVYPAPGPEGEITTIVCSGDTIVARNSRHTMQLPRDWIRAVHQLHAETDRAALYWLIMTSGYRTYRFLPLFFRWYYPSANPLNGPTNATTAPWLDGLARERWGAQYESSSGLVRLRNPQRLRYPTDLNAESEAADPHAVFFTQRNPEFARGDELVSITDLDRANLTPAGLRMLRPIPKPIPNPLTNPPPRTHR